MDREDKKYVQIEDRKYVWIERTESRLRKRREEMKLVYKKEGRKYIKDI